MLYYNNIVQVKYWNTKKNAYSYGIAYHNFIINASDGDYLEISDILNASPLDEDPTIVELEWNDLERLTINDPHLLLY